MATMVIVIVRCICPHLVSSPYVLHRETTVSECLAIYNAMLTDCIKQPSQKAQRIQQGLLQGGALHCSV